MFFFFKLECGELGWSAEREYGVIYFGKKSVIVFDTREYAESMLRVSGQFSGAYFSWGTNFRGVISLGALFPGGIFPRTLISTLFGNIPQLLY